jgi:hypothetical protein
VNKAPDSSASGLMSRTKLPLNTRLHFSLERSNVQMNMFEQNNGQAPIAHQSSRLSTDNLSKAGWSWGCVATVDREGRTIFVADAHRGDGNRFFVRADEKLTAFMELASATRACDDCKPAPQPVLNNQ